MKFSSAMVGLGLVVSASVGYLTYKELNTPTWDDKRAELKEHIMKQVGNDAPPSFKESVSSCISDGAVALAKDFKCPILENKTANESFGECVKDKEERADLVRSMLKRCVQNAMMEFATGAPVHN